MKVPSCYACHEIGKAVASFVLWLEKQPFLGRNQVDFSTLMEGGVFGKSFRQTQRQAVTPFPNPGLHCVYNEDPAAFRQSIVEGAMALTRRAWNLRHVKVSRGGAS
jgi:hypothetical protein